MAPKSSVSIGTGSRSTGWPLVLALERLDRAGRRLEPRRVHGLQVGHHRFDLEAGDEADEVEPVRADVADGPELAALALQHAPVEVGRVEQPVLHVAAVHVQHVADRPAAHERPRVNRERIEPQVVVHRRDLPRVAPSRPRRARSSGPRSAPAAFRR